MKNFINKILDMPKLIRRLWFLLWILLVILLVMKFCFGIWYPVVSNNEVFINVCEFIDNNRIVYMAIGLILYIFSVNIIFLTCMGKKKYSNWIELIIINVFIISFGILKNFNSLIINILEILFMTIPFIIINIKQNNFKNKVLNILIPILLYAVINLWQLTIFGVRGLNLNELTSYPILIPLILQIDYYIFITITWIGVCFMGIFSIGWLWSNDITQLKAIREKELKKAKPNMKKVESLDIKIAELEKEGK